MMADYAREKGLIYVDFSVLHGPDGAIRPNLSTDGVHPNREGYRLVEPRVAAAVEQARAKP
jgi:lysophospholipase L1-like esterase